MKSSIYYIFFGCMLPVSLFVYIFSCRRAECALLKSNVFHGRLPLWLHPWPNKLTLKSNNCKEDSEGLTCRENQEMISWYLLARRSWGTPKHYKKLLIILRNYPAVAFLHGHSMDWAGLWAKLYAPIIAQLPFALHDLLITFEWWPATNIAIFYCMPSYLDSAGGLSLYLLLEKGHAGSTTH